LCRRFDVRDFKAQQPHLRVYSIKNEIKKRLRRSKIIINLVSYVRTVCTYCI
jgi:hypothetical protein